MAPKTMKPTENRPAPLVSDAMSTLLPQVFDYLGGPKDVKSNNEESELSYRRTRAPARDVGSCGDFVSLVVASRLLEAAANTSATRRSRALWSTSEEAERHGLRLGALFLARRTRVRREDAAGESFMPLASSPPSRPAADKHAMDVYFVEEARRGAKYHCVGALGEAEFERLHPKPDFDDFVECRRRYGKISAAGFARPPRPMPRLADHHLFVDVIVKTFDGEVVGRRSVCVSGDDPLLRGRGPRDGTVNFEPLVVLSDCRAVIPRSQGLTPDAYRTAALIFFGHRHVADSGPVEYNELTVRYCGGVVVSVRADLFRADGKSMCLLGERDVAFEIGDGDVDDVVYEDDAILLTPGNDIDPETSLFPCSDGVFSELMHCSPEVVVDMPSEADNVFRLRAIRLGFTTSFLVNESVGGGAGSSETRVANLGHLVQRGLRALDAWQ